MGILPRCLSRSSSLAVTPFCRNDRCLFIRQEPLFAPPLVARHGVLTCLRSKKFCAAYGWWTLGRIRRGVPRPSREGPGVGSVIFLLRTERFPMVLPLFLILQTPPLTEDCTIKTQSPLEGRGIAPVRRRCSPLGRIRRGFPRPYMGGELRNEVYPHDST